MPPASVGCNPGVAIPFAAANVAKDVPNKLRRKGRRGSVGRIDAHTQHAIEPSVRRTAEALKENVVSSGVNQIAGWRHPGIEQS